jgi:phenylacetate-CoA ligase
MLLTDRYQGTVKRAGNRYYVSVEQPTDAILDAYQGIRPDLLYGFATPLRLLAERLRARRRTSHRPRSVISTAEMLDATSRESLHKGFDCPIGDFYGMTEMGLVSWQQPGRDRYIMSPNAVLTEFRRTAENGRYRMIMTNLDLHASPMIRFDTGDTVLAQETAEGLVIHGFEGRVIDTVLSRDGREFSPYRITDAMRDIPGLRRFKVIQQAIEEFDVIVEIDGGAADAAKRSIQSAFLRLLGPGLRVNILQSDRLIAEGLQKFRPVESRVAQQ